MKTFFLISAICFFSLFAQAQNTFPTPSGSVGIGTTSPSALLHVHNANNLGTSAGSTIEIARFSGVNVNISQLRFQLNRYASGNDWYSASMRLQHVIDYTNAGYIEFDPINGNAGVAIGSANNEIIRFASSGYVGIGTINPQSLLAVKGTITAQKVVVTQTGWSDYVFDSSYQLLPLSSVESFIQTNKHLPDVPSARDIQKEGNDLADNQRVLLQKIEELTLYIIQQNKKIERQETHLQTLENELHKVQSSKIAR